MKYWLDTEFIEDGKTIDLISIGIAAEDGREFYNVSTEFNPGKCSQWVKDNVFPHLPPMQHGVRFGTVWGDIVNFFRPGTYWRPRRINPLDPSVSPVDRIASCSWHTKEEIARGLITFSDSSPEFWAYYADYDWVTLCQLFGTMMDLPEWFPMYCRDIKQECDRLGNPKLPEQGKGEHNALEDARWNKLAWEFLRDYEQSP